MIDNREVFNEQINKLDISKSMKAEIRILGILYAGAEFKRGFEECSNVYTK